MTYTEPLVLLFCAIAFFGLFVLPPAKRRWIALAGVAGVFLVCWPPVDWAVSHLLESRYPLRPFRGAPGVQAIVVPGSSVEPRQYERPYPLPDSYTFARCEHAAWIYRNWGPLPVLASTGDPASSAAVRQLLEHSGIPAQHIWIEDHSRSTHENAAYAAQILARNGIRKIVLVVEAQSMPRAEACFRKQGLEVVPAPNEFRAWGPLRDELVPGWRALRRNEVTLHEMLGMLWYRLRGWV